MKKHAGIIATVAMGSMVLSACSTATTGDRVVEKPNILFFLVDDMGWQDTSVPFADDTTANNRKYHTPNMERLASQGMKFTQAYATAVCSPTRTSLMTGMNAARHRVTNWTLHRNASVDAPDEVLEFPKWNVNGLQAVDSIEHSVYATTLPQLLHDNGYYTIHCGKAHWGAFGTPGADPLTLGFDVNIAGHAAGRPASYQGERFFGNTEPSVYTQPWGVPGLEKYHGDTINLTDALTREAIAAIENSRGTGKPFYLYMSHYTVHTPLEPDKRYYQKYVDLGYDELEARYASMVEGMDQSLGDLMDYLEKNGLDKNTVILFMSDNGGLSAAERGGQRHTHNAPLNSGKGSAYEGGIREPMLAKWPDHIEAASVCDDYLIIEDFYPTILELAGVNDYQAVQPIDGKSFVPMLLQTGTTALGRDLFWHFPNKWGASGPGIGTTSTIRSGDWKLIYWYKTGEYELFNIREDLGEKHNRAAEHPEIVKELASKLGNYLRSVNAQRPGLKESGKAVVWPDEQLK